MSKTTSIAGTATDLSSYITCDPHERLISPADFKKQYSGEPSWASPKALPSGYSECLETISRYCRKIELYISRSIKSDTPEIKMRQDLSIIKKNIQWASDYYGEYGEIRISYGSNRSNSALIKWVFKPADTQLRRPVML